MTDREKLERIARSSTRSRVAGKIAAHAATAQAITARMDAIHAQADALVNGLPSLEKLFGAAEEIGKRYE